MQAFAQAISEDWPRTSCGLPGKRGRSSILLPLLVFGLALAVALVEAYTSHGLDNLTIPVVAAPFVQFFYSLRVI